MVLYATDLVELEKPAQKKRSQKKSFPVEAPVPEMEKPIEKPKTKKTSKKLQEPLLVQEIKTPETVQVPVKKTRKRKQIEEPKPEDKVPEVAPEIEVVKVDVKKPRKIKPKIEPIEVEEPITPPESESAVENIEPRKKRSKKEPNQKAQEPPVWFKKYIQGVQKEKADSFGQVTKKQEKLINKEALKVAHKSWQSGITRDRVQGEVDGHMNRMYSMIFQGR